MYDVSNLIEERFREIDNSLFWTQSTLDSFLTNLRSMNWAITLPPLSENLIQQYSSTLSELDEIPDIETLVDSSLLDEGTLSLPPSFNIDKIKEYKARYLELKASFLDTLEILTSVDKPSIPLSYDTPTLPDEETVDDFTRPTFNIPHLEEIERKFLPTLDNIELPDFESAFKLVGVDTEVYPLFTKLQNLFHELSAFEDAENLFRERMFNIEIRSDDTFSDVPRGLDSYFDDMRRLLEIDATGEYRRVLSKAYYEGLRSLSDLEISYLNNLVMLYKTLNDLYLKLSTIIYEASIRNYETQVLMYRLRIERLRYILAKYNLYSKVLDQYLSAYKDLLNALQSQISIANTRVETASQKVQYIESKIRAYHDMIEGYRSVVEAKALDIEKYKSEVEVYATKIKAIFDKLKMNSAVISANEAILSSARNTLDIEKAYRDALELQVRSLELDPDVQDYREDVEDFLNKLAVIDRQLNLYRKLISEDSRRMNIEASSYILSLIEQRLAGTIERLKASARSILNQEHIRNALTTLQYNASLAKEAINMSERIALAGARPIASLAVGLSNTVDAMVSGMYEATLEAS